MSFIVYRFVFTRGNVEVVHTKAYLYFLLQPLIIKHFVKPKNVP